MKILIKAEPKVLIALLESKQYRQMGECYHPGWNAKYKGMIYSRPSSPMFWIFDFGQPAGDTVIIWMDVDFLGGNLTIGSEMVPINEEAADAAIKSLVLLLGQEHISVSKETSGYVPILRVSII